MHKPFTTIEDQIALLNSRGLQTDSRTSWILEREGYYATVNGYKKPFLDNQARKKDEEDKYREGSSYNDLYKLYLFDRQLRFLLFGMITIAEAILKTVCAYEFTKANPAEKNPYLNIDIMLVPAKLMKRQVSSFRDCKRYLLTTVIAREKAEKNISFIASMSTMERCRCGF